MIVWQLWLERNARIFRESSSFVAQVVVKTQVLLGECLQSLSLPKNKVSLLPKEAEWLKLFQHAEVLVPSQVPLLEGWEIRFDPPQFDKWKRDQKMYSLFFDGASKGNPRAARGGGIIYDPGGTVESHYAWSIGNDTNNMAEAHALWEGLVQMKAQESQKHWSLETHVCSSKL
jgi:hypothetical protein